jgi:hypothetical protein
MNSQAQPENPYELGDRVEHAPLGHGTVIKISGRGGQVKFDAAGQIVSFAFFDYVSPSDLPEPGPKAANDNKKLISATPFKLRDPALIPERDWLFDHHYIRRYLTETVGAGGGGKSAHAVSEALAMVTGRPLLNQDGPLTKPLRA